MTTPLLITGLGNPGSEYDETRHNIGFRALRAFAAKQGFVFRRALNGMGELAQGNIGETKVVLLLPMTYMNTSGNATRLFSDYFKLAPDKLLVVCDDIYLPFGKMRLREKGSAGGHNGLKSIESHLGTLEYSRLRLGIGEEFDGDLAEHVLSKFTEEEQKKLPEFLEGAVETIYHWITEGATKAVRYASTFKLS